MFATRQAGTFYTRELDNGLRLLGQYIPGVESTASIFWVRTGSRDEPAGQEGVSHFLEHMAFRRTATRSGREVDRAFEEMGAENNAATSKEMTFYWARVLADQSPAAIDLLAELTRPALDADDFEQERPVILEEIARYEDQPAHVLTDLFFHDFFGRHPLSWEVLGTNESISALSVEQMRTYWQARYAPNNILFSIAGNFDWDAVVRQLEKISHSWLPAGAPRRTEPLVFTPGLRTHVREKFAGEQIAIGMPSVSSRDERYWAAALLASILGDDTGSRLYWSLYQEGLAEWATAQLMTYDDTGVFYVHLSSEPATARAALKVARRELERLQAFDVEPGELERAKAKLNSAVVVGGESTNERVFSLINSWLTRGKLETLQEMRDRIEAVTLEELRGLVRDFPVSPGQLTTAVGPMAAADLE